MATPFTFRDLDVWKQGMDLVETCYKTTGAFPRSELYGLTSQLRRAAVSMPSNIAEGHGRRTTKAYLMYGLHRALDRKARKQGRPKNHPALPAQPLPPNL
jgi:hypothetical protein